MGILRFVAHSKRVLCIAATYGWLPGARYTNLRDVRAFSRVGFLDIEWEGYSFERHLAAMRDCRPLMTVAKDVTEASQLPEVLEQASELSRYCKHVVVVPKDPALADLLSNGAIPRRFILGYSVPTRYGGTPIRPSAFRRPVHLLGGRPDVQRRLAGEMPVVSLDCNRFTLDAAFGDYFDGETFRPHPKGGYARCIEDSIRSINALWTGYKGGKLPCAHSRSRRYRAGL
jgi:hypothetical protein